MLSRRTLLLMTAAAPAVLLARRARPAAPEVDVPDPAPDDTCPVCGMFVAKYPYWVATVLMADGHADHFDGAKCMFKYLFDMNKFAGGYGPGDIGTVAVTDYYGVRRVDAHAALFVIGSDVLGPMGHELVPLASKEAADDFMRDHAGRGVLRFEQVTPAVVEALDDGEFKIPQDAR